MRVAARPRRARARGRSDRARRWLLLSTSTAPGVRGERLGERGDRAERVLALEHAAVVEHAEEDPLVLEARAPRAAAARLRGATIGKRTVWTGTGETGASARATCSVPTQTSSSSSNAACHSGGKHVDLPPPHADVVAVRRRTAARRPRGSAGSPSALTQIRLIGNAAALAGSAVYGWRWRDGGGVGGTTGSSGTSAASSARRPQARGLADAELGGEVAGDVDAEVERAARAGAARPRARAAVVGGTTAAGSVPSRTPLPCSHSIRPSALVVVVEVRVGVAQLRVELVADHHAQPVDARTRARAAPAREPRVELLHAPARERRAPQRRPPRPRGGRSCAAGGRAACRRAGGRSRRAPARPRPRRRSSRRCA